MAKKKFYTVKKKGGKYWVLTPSGLTIAVGHDSKIWANSFAEMFNHTNRDEATVNTIEAGAERDRKAPASREKLLEFVGMIARMTTESEFDAEGDDGPPSEDWISTLNDLIASARKLVK